MLRCTRQWLLVVALVAISLASVASAATFDLIWPDRMDVTTYPFNSGFSLSGYDMALVVNKGLTDIGAAEFFGASVTVTSSNPAVAAFAFINNPGPAITPIHPGEAIGSVGGVNNLFTSKLLPGETLHNTAPLQVITLQVDYPVGFAGSTVFDFTMTMGGNIAHYSILANFTLGPFEQGLVISFPSAARVSSSPIPTAAKPTTWGAIKKLYH